jgi:hypothetical protein
MLSLSLIQVYFGFKSCPSALEFVVSEFLLDVSESLHCSVSAPQVQVAPLPDLHQLLMFSAGTLTYSNPGTFLRHFYNMLLLLLVVVVVLFGE